MAKIGIDIDGVLADFTTDYGELLVSVTGRNILPHTFYTGWQPDTWYWERALGYTRKEEDATWEVINKSTDFWFNLAPLCPEVDLRGLAAVHDVYFITTRSGLYVKQQSEMWLRTIYDVAYPTVIISADKGAIARGIGLDIFIDDRDKNLWAVKGSSPETACYVIDYPYNRGVDSTIATRITSPADILCGDHIRTAAC